MASVNVITDSLSVRSIWQEKNAAREEELNIRINTNSVNKSLKTSDRTRMALGDPAYH